ncbi:ATP-binding protein [Streptomyces sp. NPDC048297]|uniref:ATP-binding protein n=1 Tax=Streptomyces sp. NPDC048297 TaxID=3365531 RepID=UPI00372414F3
MAVQLNTLVREAYEHVCPVPPAAGAVPAARRQVATLLDDWHVSAEIVDDALLVVSELITNAIVHALPPALLRVSWIREDAFGTLRVEVSDKGPALAAGRCPPGVDPDEHGRGMEIVHALATRYGLHVAPGAITRWADLVALSDGAGASHLFPDQRTVAPPR